MQCSLNRLCCVVSGFLLVLSVLLNLFLFHFYQFVLLVYFVMFRPYLFLLLFVECHIGVFYMSSIDVCA